MDYAVESLEKTSDIERKTTINKLHNMQWLKNTTHSANPEKIKAIIYKQDQDENKKIEDKISALVETVKICLSEGPNKYSSTLLHEDTCKTYLCDDTMPKNDENIWSKNASTPHLFLNADDKLADQKNEEDMLSIVESMVTAKLETEFCIKEHKEEPKDQLNNSEDKPEDINQGTVCTNHSDLQKTNGGTEEVKLIKHSDGNNNDSKSTPCMSKVNNKQKSICKVTSIESSKASIEAKDKDMHVKTNTKTIIKADGNTNLTKDNEKFSSPNNDSKKTVSNSSKSLSTTDRNGRDYFNNKQNNTRSPCMKKQEFAKQRNVSRNGIEKDMKNTIAKPNLAKTGNETADTPCQNKNSNKDKASQKQQTTSKQFAPKSKGQESFRRNVSMVNFDDKNKTERAPHTLENVELPLNDSERKDEKIINEKTVQSDQKANRGVDLKKNTTFVAQYKNSTFSKPLQNGPRIGQSPMYGRNQSYVNPKFDRDRNARVPKKEHVSNTFTKSNIGIEEFNTNNLENCAKQTKEIIQPTNVKSTDKVDARVFNDKKDMNPVTVETHLTQSKENRNSSVDHPEQGPTTSEQCRIETNEVSKEIDQQCKETNNEEMNAFKHSNLSSDKCATNSQINVHQYSLKENMQRTNDVTQLENSLTIWNQSDNAAQNGATMMGLQQSFQNMDFNTQPTFTQAENPTRHMSAWESNNSKFYDQHFPASDVMRLPQIPNTFNAPSPYECNAQMPSDNGIAAISMMDAISNNRDNSNMFYRYGSNVQQRPVMASEFPGHSIPCQTNQAKWSSSVQDGFHVEHSYVPTQPAMMHVYNPAVFNSDDFNNAHTMDYLSHPVIYAQAPYMQTYMNSQLQYSMPVLYNTPCTNYSTFSHSNQPDNFNSVHDQQHRHNSYAQMNNYVRDTYNDTSAVQTRNTVDNVPIKPNYYYKKYQDNYRPVYDAPPYVPSVSYSRSQQDGNYMPATGINQYNAPYCSSNQKQYKQTMPNYMKYPKNQIQDLPCDDNGSEDAPPIISPTEFVTNNINLSNKTDQFATRVFKPEFKMKSNSGYRPPSVPRYGGGFRRNTTFQDFPKQYSYPVSIGRGTYNKAKKT